MAPVVVENHAWFVAKNPLVADACYNIRRRCKNNCQERDRNRPHNVREIMNSMKLRALRRWIDDINQDSAKEREKLIA